MAHLQTKIPTHASKVCSLYKRALRNIENWQLQPTDVRYEAVLMRHRFDQNKHFNQRIGKKLLADGEDELFKSLHPIRKQFADCPGGVAYMRTPKFLDCLQDFWDPIEKAQYPSHFAKREMWKRERIDRWEKKYGKINDPWADY